QTVRAFAFGQLARIVDSTGLKGNYDFDLHFSQRAIAGSSDSITVKEAVDKQLGLKLEQQNVPTPGIVVESALSKPTDSAPDISARLPAIAPPEIEAAVIKPSATNPTPRPGRMAAGLIEYHDMPLRALITMAWEIPGGQEVFGAPKWLQNDSPR